VVHESSHMGYITKNRNRVPPNEELEMISSRDPEAELVKVFLHKSEKNQLKELAAEQGIPVSHLMRVLALQWVKQSDETL
jgi:16S rRNA U516 pseudouridylate synthase RsuA-like enzyme